MYMCILSRNLLHPVYTVCRTERPHPLSIVNMFYRNTVSTIDARFTHAVIHLILCVLTMQSSLFHIRTRTAYLYNGCLAWYNVLITSQVHSSVKSQFPKIRKQNTPLRTRATVE